MQSPKKNSSPNSAPRPGSPMSDASIVSSITRASFDDSPLSSNSLSEMSTRSTTEAKGPNHSPTVGFSASFATSTCASDSLESQTDTETQTNLSQPSVPEAGSKKPVPKNKIKPRVRHDDSMTKRVPKRVKKVSFDDTRKNEPSTDIGSTPVLSERPSKVPADQDLKRDVTKKPLSQTIEGKEPQNPSLGLGNSSSGKSFRSPNKHEKHKGSEVDAEKPPTKTSEADTAATAVSRSIPASHEKAWTSLKGNLKIPPISVKKTAVGGAESVVSPNKGMKPELPTQSEVKNSPPRDTYHVQKESDEFKQPDIKKNDRREKKVSFDDKIISKSDKTPSASTDPEPKNSIPPEIRGRGSSPSFRRPTISGRSPGLNHSEFSVKDPSRNFDNKLPQNTPQKQSYPQPKPKPSAITAYGSKEMVSDVELGSVTPDQSSNGSSSTPSRKFSVGSGVAWTSSRGNLRIPSIPRRFSSSRDPSAPEVIKDPKENITIQAKSDINYPSVSEPVSHKNLTIAESNISPSKPKPATKSDLDNLKSTINASQQDSKDIENRDFDDPNSNSADAPKERSLSPRTGSTAELSRRSRPSLISGQSTPNKAEENPGRIKKISLKGNAKRKSGKPSSDSRSSSDSKSLNSQISDYSNDTLSWESSRSRTPTSVKDTPSVKPTGYLFNSPSSRVSPEFDEDHISKLEKRSSQETSRKLSSGQETPWTSCKGTLKIPPIPRRISKTLHSSGLALPKEMIKNDDIGKKSDSDESKGQIIFQPDREPPISDAASTKSKQLKSRQKSNSFIATSSFVSPYNSNITGVAFDPIKNDTTNVKSDPDPSTRDQVASRNTLPTDTPKMKNRSLTPLSGSTADKKSDEPENTSYSTSDCKSLTSQFSETNGNSSGLSSISNTSTSVRNISSTVQTDDNLTSDSSKRSPKIVPPSSTSTPNVSQRPQTVTCSPTMKHTPEPGNKTGARKLATRPSNPSLEKSSRDRMQVLVPKPKKPLLARKRNSTGENHMQSGTSKNDSKNDYKAKTPEPASKVCVPDCGDKLCLPTLESSGKAPTQSLLPTKVGDLNSKIAVPKPVAGRVSSPSGSTDKRSRPLSANKRGRNSPINAFSEPDRRKSLPKVKSPQMKVVIPMPKQSGRLRRGKKSPLLDSETEPPRTGKIIAQSTGHKGHLPKSRWTPPPKGSSAQYPPGASRCSDNDNNTPTAPHYRGRTSPRIALSNSPGMNVLIPKTREIELLQRGKSPVLGTEVIKTEDSESKFEVSPSKSLPMTFKPRLTPELKITKESSSILSKPKEPFPKSSPVTSKSRWTTLLKSSGDSTKIKSPSPSSRTEQLSVKSNQGSFKPRWNPSLKSSVDSPTIRSPSPSSRTKELPVKSAQMSFKPRWNPSLKNSSDSPKIRSSSPSSRTKELPVKSAQVSFKPRWNPSLKSSVDSPKIRSPSPSSRTKKLPSKSTQMPFKPRWTPPLASSTDFRRIRSASPSSGVEKLTSKSAQLQIKPRWNPPLKRPKSGPPNLTFKPRWDDSLKNPREFPKNPPLKAERPSPKSSPVTFKPRLTPPLKSSGDSFKITSVDTSPSVGRSKSESPRMISFKPRWDHSVKSSKESLKNRPQSSSLEDVRLSSKSAPLTFKPRWSPSLKRSKKFAQVESSRTSTQPEVPSSNPPLITFKPRWNMSTRSPRASPDRVALSRPISPKLSSKEFQTTFMPRWNEKERVITKSPNLRSGPFPQIKVSSPSDLQWSARNEKSPIPLPKMKTIIPRLRQTSARYRTRLSPVGTSGGASPMSDTVSNDRTRPTSLSVGPTTPTKGYSRDRLSPSRLKLKLRTPSPISARKPWDSSITTPEPRYIRSSSPSPIPSPISLPRTRPSSATRFCSSCSPVSSTGPVLYAFNSFAVEPRVRYKSLDDRPPWNSNTKTPPLFSVVTPLDDLKHRRMSIRTAVRHVRSPIHYRTRFASAPAETQTSTLNRKLRTPGWYFCCLSKFKASCDQPRSFF